MVREFQSVIGREARAAVLAARGTRSARPLVACVGGGSNAIGIFAAFLSTRARLYRRRGGRARRRARRPRGAILRRIGRRPPRHAHDAPAGRGGPGPADPLGLGWPRLPGRRARARPVEGLGTGRVHARLRRRGARRLRGPVPGRKASFRRSRAPTRSPTRSRSPGACPPRSWILVNLSGRRRARTSPNTRDLRGRQRSAVADGRRGDEDAVTSSRLPSPCYLSPVSRLPSLDSSTNRIASAFEKARSRAAGGLHRLPDGGGLLGRERPWRWRRARIGPGTDILELGVPFSDPIADGPVLQRSAERASPPGPPSAVCSRSARRIRAETNLGLVLFSYLNPCAPRAPARGNGAERPRSRIRRNSSPICRPKRPGTSSRRPAGPRGLDTWSFSFPRLARPGRMAARSPSSGFLYVVSRSGTTGSARRALSHDLLKTVAAGARAARSLPIASGSASRPRNRPPRASRLADGGRRRAPRSCARGRRGLARIARRRSSSCASARPRACRRRGKDNRESSRESGRKRIRAERAPSDFGPWTPDVLDAPPRGNTCGSSSGPDHAGRGPGGEILADRDLRKHHTVRRASRRTQAGRRGSGGLEPRQHAVLERPGPPLGGRAGASGSAGGRPTGTSPGASPLTWRCRRRWISPGWPGRAGQPRRRRRFGPGQSGKAADGDGQPVHDRAGPRHRRRAGADPPERSRPSRRIRGGEPSAPAQRPAA